MPDESVEQQLGALRERVLADPALAARLSEHRDLDALARALAALAPDLSCEALRSALGSARGAKDVVLDPRTSSGWSPISIAEDGEVRWARIGEARPGPFHSDDVRRALTLPLHRFVRPRSSLDALEIRRAHVPSLPIAGLIFHASRVGSTLITSALGADPSTLAVAEPAPIDDVLGLRGTAEEHAMHLSAVAAALCERGVDAAPMNTPPSDTVFTRARQTRAVLKLDAWHVLQVGVFARAFPGVPRVFVVREPLEILVSHAHRRGSHMVPGAVAERLLPAHPVPVHDLDGHAARVLRALFEAALAARGELLVVDHSELPSAIERRILPWFGLAPTTNALASMRAVVTQDAKSPDRPYTDDREAKRASASPRLIALADALRPLYDALVRSA